MTFYYRLLPAAEPAGIPPIKEKLLWSFGCAIIKVAHQCQSKTLSPPDFESTYTNKASLEAFAACKFRQV